MNAKPAHASYLESQVDLRIAGDSTKESTLKLRG
jgi:hypothetical protein